MPATPIQPEQMQRVQAALAREAAFDQPPMSNVEAATTFHDHTEVEIEGRVYRQPYLSWRQGIWLRALDEEMRALSLYPGSAEVTYQRLRISEQLAVLLWRIIRPRWWQRLGRNPLWYAEESQLKALTDFFSSARTRSRVRMRRSVRAPRWVLQTSTMHSHSLRVGIRAGWRRTATLAATPITSADSAGSVMKPSAPAVFLVR